MGNLEQLRKFFFIGTFAGFRQIYLAVKKLERDDTNHEPQ